MASIQIRGDKYSVVYRYTDGGRKKQKWETYRTEKEAKIRKAEIEMQALKGNIMMQSKQTVEAFLCEWMSTYDTNWSPKTKEAYRGFLKNHIAPLIGSKPLSTVLPEDIAEMKKELAMRKSIKNEKATLSSTTQKHILKYLHLAFEQAVDWGRVAKNPVTCAMPKRSRSTRGAWEVSEIQKALPSIIDPCLHLAVHIALQCSLRIGEIMAISLDDIDLDRRQVDINRSMQRVCLSDVSEADDEKIFHTFPHAKGSKSALVLKETKTPNSDRSVYFGDSLKKELETRLAVIARQKELLGDEYKNYGLLFADEFGNPVEPNQMGKMFRKWMERESSGIRKICFHELRHTKVPPIVKTRISD